MSTRKRIRTTTPGEVGSSDVTPSTALVEWGPDFGENPGNDGVTFGVGVGVDLEALGLAGNLGVGVGVDLEQLGLAGNLGVGVGVDLEQLGLAGNLGVGVGLSGEVRIPQLYATQDAWVGADTLCADNLNHDGEDLQFDGLLVQEKEVLLGWDLSPFTAGATVTEALLTVQWKANLLEILGNDVDIFSIDDADETWDETTVTCSTRPAQDTLLQTFTWTPSGILVGVSQTITLNAAVRSRMSDRMGVGQCTFLLNLATANLLSREMESKDEGTDDALGPRLDFTFAIP